MKKPASLRAFLVAALPQHRLDADDRLRVRVLNGAVAADGRPGHGFGYAYTLELIFLDFAGDTAEITVPVVAWISRWQHDLLQGRETSGKVFSIEVEVLDNQKVDARVTIQLTEAVAFSPREGGGYDAVYLEERLPFAFESGAPLHAVYLDGELAVHCAAHQEA